MLTSYDFDHADDLDWPQTNPPFPWSSVFHIQGSQTTLPIFKTFLPFKESGSTHAKGFGGCLEAIFLPKHEDLCSLPCLIFDHMDAPYGVFGYLSKTDYFTANPSNLHTSVGSEESRMYLSLCIRMSLSTITLVLVVEVAYSVIKWHRVGYVSWRISSYGR